MLDGIPSSVYIISSSYVDSSKGTEATVAREIATGIHTEHQGCIFVLEIVSDDDSTMRAKSKSSLFAFKTSSFS